MTAAESLKKDHFSINAENDTASHDDDDVPSNKEQLPMFGGSGLKGDNDLAIDKK